MFDIGFWELGLIAVIALIVVGPERLPRLARTAGLWLGKIRSSVRNVRDEIEREIAADELKKQLARNMGSEDVYEIVDDARSLRDDLEGRPRIDQGDTPQRSAAEAAAQGQTGTGPHSDTRHG